MPEELTIADIQLPFLEYRAPYKEPIAPIWFGRQQGEIINKLLKALAPWQVNLENITWNQAAKNLGEAQLSFAVPSLFSTLNVGVGGLTITTLYPDWSRAPVLASLFQAGVDALRGTIGQELQSQQATLGFHLKPGARPFRETVSRFVNAKALGSEDAAFFGVSVYRGDNSFVIDSSASIPMGVFVKITRNFSSDKRIEEITAILYKDEETVLGHLGLKLK
jgi:hypothetical protein